MKEQINALMTEPGLEWTFVICFGVLIFSIWLRYYSGRMKRW